MPSFKTAGKSKEDLAVVAQLSGLLTPEESAQMTRAELVKLFEKENRKSEKTVRKTVKSAIDESVDMAPVQEATQPEMMDETEIASGQPPEIVPIDKPSAKSRTGRSRKSAEPPAAVAKVKAELKSNAKKEPAKVQPTEPEKPRARRPARTSKIAVQLEMPVMPAALLDSADAIAAEPQKDNPPVEAPPLILEVQPSLAKRPASEDEIADQKNMAEPDLAKPAKSRRTRKESPEGVAPAPEPAAVPAPIAVPAPLAVPEPAAVLAAGMLPEKPAEEPLKPVRRTAGRRRKDLPEQVLEEKQPAGIEPLLEINQNEQPASDKPAVAIEQPVVSEPPAAKALPAGRGARKNAAKRQPAIQDEILEFTAEPGPGPSNQAYNEAVAEAVSETRQDAAADQTAEQSPEASEAASDNESAGDHADIHRVLPHHTLKVNKPGPRRTTRIIGDSSPDAAVSSQPDFSAGTSASPIHQTNRRTHHFNEAANVTAASGRSYPAAPASDKPSNSSEQASSGSAAAEQAATIVPLLPGTEAEAPKGHRPFVETGDIQAGVLEIMPDGYGFLRKENYLQGNKDIYVPPQYIRRFGLRPGDYVTGPVKLQRESDRYQALLYIKDVNGLPPEKMLRRPHFDRLTPIYPDNRFILETVRNELSTRIIDLVAPIGKGQRGMIVSPPKAGKTILLQKIANAISTNNPDVKLIVLLIDERPEEVTDMQRSINGEVVYSTFDKTPENHTKVTELVLERAMRLVELKQDVVILLDSMTRLARAYNLTINPTGRTLSGGLDPGALYGPKRFFGAARNIENGGSLTIIATSLIETGSRMDEVIFEEFKGTGNMEVYLDRKMSEKRIFPAIDINKSGTRREELLMTTKELDAVWTIRKAFSQLDTTAVTEAIINLLLKTKNNEHFISSVNVSFNDKNVFEAMRGVRPPESGPNANPPPRGGGYNNSAGGYNSNYRRQTISANGDED